MRRMNWKKKKMKGNQWKLDFCFLSLISQLVRAKWIVYPRWKNNNEKRDGKNHLAFINEEQGHFARHPAWDHEDFAYLIDIFNGCTNVKLNWHDNKQLKWSRSEKWWWWWDNKALSWISIPFSVSMNWAPMCFCLLGYRFWQVLIINWYFCRYPGWRVFVKN
jgi:hypothetical protein